MPPEIVKDIYFASLGGKRIGDNKVVIARAVESKVVDFRVVVYVG